LGGQTWELDVEASVEGPAEADRTPGAAPPAANETRKSSSPPPSAEQLVEAMLFVGGHPLTSDHACAAVRGLTPERFHEAIDALNRRYQRQRRPYTVQVRDDGYLLSLLPRYRSLRERLFGGPREARLGQAALDVLAV